VERREPLATQRGAKQRRRLGRRLVEQPRQQQPGPVE